MTPKEAIEELRDDLLNLYMYVRGQFTKTTLKTPEERKAIKLIDQRLAYLRNMKIEGGEEDGS